MAAVHCIASASWHVVGWQTSSSTQLVGLWLCGVVVCGCSLHCESADTTHCVVSRRQVHYTLKVASKSTQQVCIDSPGAVQHLVAGSITDTVHQPSVLSVVAYACVAQGRQQQ